MQTCLSAMLVAFSIFAMPGPSAAATFNLRASLEHGYYVSGTVSIDPLTGVVTGEQAALYRNGVPLSAFGAPMGQGPFAPGGGVAPSYLFPSVGSNGYAFIGAIPTPSLTGYAGGELCALASMVRCAYSDLFLGGSTVANAIQGVLLPVGDTIETYTLSGTFENGDNITGTVIIDTTAGFVLDQYATLFSHGVVVDQYFAPQVQSVFAPGGGVSASYLLQSTGPGGVLLNLGIPGSSLADYGGGDLCATGNGLTCAFSNIFLTSTVSSNAIGARLVRQRSVPEPSTGSLVAMGLLACALAWRRHRGSIRGDASSSRKRSTSRS